MLYNHIINALPHQLLPHDIQGHNQNHGFISRNSTTDELFIQSLFVFLIPFFIFSWAFPIIIKPRNCKSFPPAASYNLPFLGHALSIAWDMPGFLTSTIKRHVGGPINLRILQTNVCLIAKKAHFIELFNQSQKISNKFYRTALVGNTFAMPAKAQDFLAADDSGLNHISHRTSNVKPEHRVDYLIHSSLSKFLSGPSLKSLAVRFQENLSKNLAQLDIGDEWIELSDLYDFVRVQLFNASACAMFGPYLLTLNPTLYRDFWHFDQHLGYLTKGYPRWLNRSAYRAQERCLAAVKTWHEFIREHCEGIQCGTDSDYNPKFGAEIVRYRQRMYSKMEAMNTDAVASEDLGLLWGANANSGRAAFWLLYETLRSRTLLQRARDAMRASIAPQSGSTGPLTRQPSIITSNASLPFDFPIFSSAPLIQSMYAETLRLRFAFIILRSVKDDVTLGDCFIPQKNVIAMSTYHAHRDQESWNANTVKGPHSLDEFWAERFLVYPGNSSTPLKPSSKDKNGTTPWNMENETTTSPRSSIPVAAKLNENPVASPHFSTEGLAGAWIPYGRGQNMCPGRHFAKQEVLVIFASILTSFDIHLIDDSPPKVDWRGFGLGMLAPAGKGIRFRIKRRRHLW